MANQPIYDMTDTWSQAGTKHTAIKLNVTDAASTSDSALLDLQIGGNTRILGGKDGSLTLAGVVRPVRAAIASLKSASEAGEGAIAYATGAGGGLVVSDGTTWRPLALGGSKLAIENGGTGAGSAAEARTNLGALSVDSKTTGAQIRAGADEAGFVTAKALVEAMAFVPVVPSTIDLSAFINGQVTLTANSTFAAPTNGKAGVSGTLRIQQDATGTRTAGWNAFWDFGTAGVPTLSTAANAIDYVFYQIDAGASKAVCTFRKGT